MEVIVRDERGNKVWSHDLSSREAMKLENDYVKIMRTDRDQLVVAYKVGVGYRVETN